VNKLDAATALARIEERSVRRAFASTYSTSVRLVGGPLKCILGVVHVAGSTGIDSSQKKLSVLREMENSVMSTANEANTPG
jgi:hypothetical protein